MSEEQKLTYSMTFLYLFVFCKCIIFTLFLFHLVEFTEQYKKKKQVKRRIHRRKERYGKRGEKNSYKLRENRRDEDRDSKTYEDKVQSQYP